MNFKVKCVCFNIQPILAILDFSQVVRIVCLSIYMYVNTAWRALEVQNQVCLFKYNYFELHNTEFLKTCTFYRL